jgi:hypothetical protein
MIDNSLCGLYSSEDGVVFAVGDEVYDLERGFGRLAEVRDPAHCEYVMDFECRQRRQLRVLNKNRVASMVLAARAMRGQEADPRS